MKRIEVKVINPWVINRSLFTLCGCDWEHHLVKGYWLDYIVWDSFYPLSRKIVPIIFSKN